VLTDPVKKICLRALKIPGKERRRIMASIRPLHDRVIIKRIEEEEQVRGGIIIPDSAKEKPQEGEVVAAGNGKILNSGERVALEVKEGDRVLFGKYAGNEVKLDDEEYLIMREDDILGIIERAGKAKGKGK
jgi:chaperonin GroES